MRVRSLIVLAATFPVALPTAFAQLTPTKIEARKLVEVPESDTHILAVKAVIAMLRKEGEDVGDFYVTPIETREDGLLELSIWHKRAFEEPEVVGNPGGKSRTVIFDTKSQQIAQVLWWQ